MAMKEPFQSEWLLEAVRLSLHGVLPSSSRISSVDSEPPIQRDPRFRKLVEGLLFSRRFILTYQLGVIGFIALVGINHWGKRLVRWRRRGRRSKARTLHDPRPINSGDRTERLRHHVSESTHDTRGIPSSSSSTSNQSLALSPDLKDADESSLLLQTKQRPQSMHSSPSLSIRAFLMYQPGPLPILQTALPPNGTILVVLLLISMNLFYALFRTSFKLDALLILGDRCGLLFVSNLPWLYILAAKTQPLKLITGYSYESLNIFHRRLGEIMCVAALIHGLCMLSVWYTLLRPSGYTLFQYLSLKIVLTGLGALIAFESLYFSSLAAIRHACYEIFLGLHIILQISALLLLFLHHRNSRGYVTTAIGVFLVDRILYRLVLKSATSSAELLVMEDEDTVRVSALVHLKERSYVSSILGGSVTRGWASGDHVFLSIPSLAMKHVFQAHPFSIISSATSEGSRDARLELLIRARDGFSADLLREALKRKSLTARIDGPYGSSRSRELLEDSDLALLVAGGSGIAIVWPLLLFLLERERSGDQESLRGSRWQKHIVLIWVMQKSCHISWIGHSALKEAENTGVDIILPGATEADGRPNLEEMIQDTVSNYKHARQFSVIVSGPDSMTRIVRNKCSALVGAGYDMNIVTEKFGW